MKYHYGQIVTKRKNIEEILCAKGYNILKAIIFCIYAGPEHDLYNVNLLAAAMNLFFIDILVYKGKGGYKKLSQRTYEIHLFEGYAECPEEVKSLLKRLGFNPTEGEVEYVYEVLYAMKQMIIVWLTMTDEVAYAPDFAYHIDYFIKNKVKNLPEPNVKGFLPLNYPKDYKVSDVNDVVQIIRDINNVINEVEKL